MLKVHTKYGVTSVEYEGSVSEIAADALTVMRSLWDSLDDEDDRDAFEEMITLSIKDTFKSVEELHEEAMSKVPLIAKMLTEMDADTRKRIVDIMPDDMLAEVMAEVTEDVD